MKELLKKLLEAEVLTEETRTELETAFAAQLDEAKTLARADATANVTAELKSQWISERETLIEALDSRVTEALTDELTELREDIERFRDVEAEYAEKLVEAKSEMAILLKKDVSSLIEHLDVFLETRLVKELEEFRADVAEVKKNEFGKKIFESFVSEFKKHYAGDDSIEGQLTETEQRLEDALAALEEAEKKSAKMERSIKMEKVLAPISGKNREVMEAILKTFDTSMLEQAYDQFIGRVLRESAEPSAVKTSEQESKVLAEGKKTVVISGVVKTGDNVDLVKEQAIVESTQVKQPTMSDAERAQLRRNAGLYN